MEKDYRNEEDLCPEIHYQETAEGVVLTACYGTDGRIFLPDKIEGEPVVAIAPYTFAVSSASESFSGQAKGEDKIWLSADARFGGERRRIGADDVAEVHLPRFVREIGSYAFYRCRNMQRLSFHDELPSIGGGALTGCRFGEVQVFLHEGERSALKSVLDEIRFAIRVKFHKASAACGEERDWELLFPEHYEEAIENTPARLLYTSHHGAGGYYRQCFHNRELDYGKYDALLPRAIAEEAEETVTELALLRLFFPHRLTEAAGSSYEQYIKAHMNTAVELSIDNENAGWLTFLSKNGYWTESALDFGIEYARQRDKTELLGIMMDEKYRKFPAKGKTFLL